MLRISITVVLFSIFVMPAAAEDRPFFGVRFGEEATIEHLFKGAPAEKAGLEIGDVIIAADEKPIDSTPAVKAFLSARKPGDKIELKVKREGKELAVSVELVKHTVNFYLTQEDPPRIPGGTVKLNGGTIGSDYQSSGNTCIKGPSKIDGSFTQEWTGILDLRLSKPNDTPLMAVSGRISLAGLLFVKIEGHEPKLGDSFELIGGAPALSGEFDVLMLPPLNEKLAWKVIYDNVEQMQDLDGDKLHDVTLLVVDGRMPMLEK